MANEFYGEGNLGQTPEVKDVEIDGETTKVANLRVYFDRPKPVGDGFEDKGGFWMDVAVWGKEGEHCARLLSKGSRVAVTGELHEDSWEADGETRRQLKVRAKRVLLVLNNKLESVQYRQTETANSATA